MGQFRLAGPASGCAPVLSLTLLLLSASALPSPAPAQQSAPEVRDSPTDARNVPRPSARVPDLAREAPPFQVVIEGGRLVDGTGNAWYRGDVGIRDDRIARIAPPGILADAPAEQRVDARGMVVAPGFIDIQSHSRYALLHGDGRVVSKVSQGVTTEIMGEGTTDAPLNPRSLDLSSVSDSSERARLRAFSGARSFDAWLRAMEERGGSVNMGSFVGGGSIRSYVTGRRSGRPTAEQLDTMRAVTRRAMEDGAFGVATALIYPPGSYTTTAELVEISRAMAPYGGVYITHLRSEADRYLEGIDEALEIGDRAGVPVEIYHLKAAGQRNWRKGPMAVEKLDSARDAGLDVQASMYPYTAASTGLTSCLPPWASDGGALYDNLEDPETRRRIVGEMLGEIGDWENLCQLATPEGVLLLGLERPENRRWIGRRLSEVAEATGERWVDVVVDLILSERQRVPPIYFLMSEENVRDQLRQPWIKFGSDAGGVNPNAGLGPIHPRAYGTFPRILGRYVREEGVLSIEEAVRKATSAVATRLSIRDRGLLAEGFFADVVVFDPETVQDRSTYEDPHRTSRGIRHVFVNGEQVLRDGRHTGARPGRIVRGPGYVPAPEPDRIVGQQESGNPLPATRIELDEVEVNPDLAAPPSSAPPAETRPLPPS